jgi:MYXO-CTERM domain-containing protein
MPPPWASDSIWWSDDFHAGLHGAPSAQANVLDLADKLRANQIHASAILVDRPFGTGTQGWGNFDFDSSFPRPAQLVTDLHDRGLNLILWVANRSWNSLYTQGNTAGYLFPGSATLGPAVDLRDADAYKWLQDKHDAFAALGVKGYKIDRGEQGEHPDAVQNENVTLYARLTREGLRAHHGDDVLVFARNVCDSGRQHAAVWNGDSQADFTGLRYSIAAGLRSGAIVMPIWGSDTGGYLRGGGGPSEEVFARWLGFSAMSPMMEVLIGPGTTPWYDYSARLVAIARKHAAAHHDLAPYARSFLYAATKTGAPLMRPLTFSFPDDPALIDATDAYLFGSELLVAPVTTGGATSRSVYLPAGLWLDYNDRRTIVDGSRSVSTAAPLDTIPVFAREGAIVPRGDLFKGNNDWTPGWAPALRLEIFPSVRFTSRFDYYTGAAVVPITVARAQRAFTIGFGDLGAGGAIELYTAAPTAVIRNGVRLAAGSYDYDLAAQRLTVSFSGATTLVVEGGGSLFGGSDPEPSDAGADPDGGAADAPIPDAPPDAPIPDAPVPDAPADAPVPEAPVPDALVPDAPFPDAPVPVPDTAAIVEGGPDVAVADAALDGAIADAAPDAAAVPAADVAPPDGRAPDSRAVGGHGGAGGLPPFMAPDAMAATPPAQASDGGCSYAPGDRAPGPVGALALAAVGVLGRRRRRRPQD